MNKFISQYGLLLVMSVVAIAMNAAADSSDRPTLGVKFWSSLPGRNAHDLALLEAALSETVEQYGPFNISVYYRSLGPSRGRRELELGNLINIYAAPVRPPEVAANENIIIVKHPILSGLLGYRALIVHDETLKDLKKIKNLNDLSSISIGQGKGWLDADIIRANGISVVAETNYPNLHSMLDRRRFDVLALSVIEAPASLERHIEKFPDQMICDFLLIYYPFPVAFQVSGNHPKIAERVAAGLARVRDSGEQRKIFEAHYSSALASLRHSQPRIIVLKNPLLEDDLGLSEPTLLKEIAP